MAEDRRALKFVRKLVRKLHEEDNLPLKISKQASQKEFKKRVSSLPSGEIKEQLETKFNFFSNKFFIFAKRVNSESEKPHESVSKPAAPKSTADDDSGIVYNLFADGGVEEAIENLKSLPNDKQSELARCLYQASYPNENSSQVMDLVLGNDLEGDTTERKLKALDYEQTLSLGNTAEKTLSSFMNSVLRTMTDLVEEAIERDDIKRVQMLQDKLMSFLTAFKLRSFNGDQDKKDQYYDLMAANLAVFLDAASFVSSRSAEASAREAGARVIPRALLLLDHSAGHFFECLTQMTSPAPGGGRHSDFMIPLFRKAMSLALPVVTNRLYISYMVMVRRAQSLCADSYPDDVTEFFQTAGKIPAPGDFLSWVCNIDSEILDATPLTVHSKPSKVTKFILGKDSTKEFLESLTDCITEIEEADGSSVVVETGDGKEEEEDKAADDLFFFDVSADRNILEQFSDSDDDPDREIAEQLSDKEVEDMSDDSS